MSRIKTEGAKEEEEKITLKKTAVCGFVFQRMLKNSIQLTFHKLKENKDTMRRKNTS